MKRLFLLVALLSVFSVGCTEDMLDDLKGFIGVGNDDVNVPNNQIWYTTNNDKPLSTNDVYAFGANILSNIYDAENQCWIITFDGVVTTIGDYAFAYCSSLTSVTIPDSVTTIGEGTFRSCSSLTSINIPDSVTTIGNYAFSGCSSLTSVTIPKRVTTIGECAFFDCSALKSVTIPKSVTTIGERAFYNCSALKSVTIPKSVTTIGEKAFYNCSSLRSVTIPDSVTTIGTAALTCCSNLTKINGKFASGDGRCLIVDGTLNSFAPAGLTEYTIPEGVTTIGNEAFYNCGKLTAVTILEGVTTIGECAFSLCDNLLGVSIPLSVVEIGSGAFSYCEQLSTVYCKAIIPPAVGDIVLDGNASNRKIYVPNESVETYKSAAGWCDYAHEIWGYDF